MYTCMCMCMHGSPRQTAERCPRMLALNLRRANKFRVKLEPIRTDMHLYAQPTRRATMRSECIALWQNKLSFFTIPALRACDLIRVDRQKKELLSFSSHFANRTDDIMELLFKVQNRYIIVKNRICKKTHTCNVFSRF